MSLVASNWPLRLVCCAALLLWMPERSAADAPPRAAINGHAAACRLPR